MRKRAAPFRRAAPSYDLALEAFREARYFDSLDYLRGIEPSIVSETLQLRILLRLGRWDDAKARIAKHGALLAQASSPGEQAVLCSLAARVYEVSGSDAVARGWYAQAYELVQECTDPELAAEVQYYLALSAYSARDEGRFAVHISDVLASGQPWLRALGHSLRGLFAVYQADYERALTDCESALLLFASEPGARDRWIEAHCLRVYVDLVHALDSEAYAVAALACYLDFNWTAELSRVRYEISVDLAEVFAASGDHIRAYRMLREAEQFAAGPSQLFLIRSLRCIQASRDNERKFAENELDAAEALFRSIEWQHTDLEQRLTLLVFALAAAPIRMQAADDALQVYETDTSVSDPRRAFSSDPRLSSIEKYFLGRVRLIRGDRDSAVCLFEEALREAVSLGFAFFEHRAAEALAQLGVPTPGVRQDRVLSATEQRELIELFVPPDTRPTI